jgi:sirohydrochlorin cobaltochelatase
VRHAAVAQLLAELLGAGKHFMGEVAITASPEGYELCHWEDLGKGSCEERLPQDAAEIARFDDAGAYRPLKTAPNLRHGWKIVAPDLPSVALALELLYPGRLAAFTSWRAGTLQVTAMRATLERQTGMYRVAARITDEQIDGVVASFCRSNGGCLRTILWRRDGSGAAPASLPPTKFDPQYDQTGRGAATIPLLCQEICPVVLAASRAAAKAP